MYVCKCVLVLSRLVSSCLVLSYKRAIGGIGTSCSGPILKLEIGNIQLLLSLIEPCEQVLVLLTLIPEDQSDVVIGCDNEV